MSRIFLLTGMAFCLFGCQGGGPGGVTRTYGKAVLDPPPTNKARVAFEKVKESDTEVHYRWKLRADRLFQGFNVNIKVSGGAAKLSNTLPLDTLGNNGDAFEVNLIAKLSENADKTDQLNLECVLTAVDVQVKGPAGTASSTGLNAKNNVSVVLRKKMKATDIVTAVLVNEKLEPFPTDVVLATLNTENVGGGPKEEFRLKLLD